jgi:hypothetical protein
VLRKLSNEDKYKQLCNELLNNISVEELLPDSQYQEREEQEREDQEREEQDNKKQSKNK